MKILHVSDTHLGYSAYRKTTPDGVNQRELDIYKSFEQFVDYAIKNKADLIIHSGDLFDTVRPNNRAITFTVDQLYRLSDENIPIFIIAGNHEHPKLRETGHIFQIFDHIKNVTPVYKAKYEKHDFTINQEKISVHAIPQCNLKTDFEKEINKLKIDKKSKYNILTVHGAVTGIHAFSMNEFNELIIPNKTLNKDFDYIALGHYHKYSKIGKNAYYSGSTDHLTFTEATDPKGFIELTKQKEKLKPVFKTLKTRPMIDAKPIKCKNLRLEQIMSKIKNTIQDIKPENKTFRIKLEDISPEIYRSLDFNEINKISNKALHFEIKAEVNKEEIKLKTNSKIDALATEFSQFLKEQNLEEEKTLLELGLGYIDKIEAREEGK